MKQLESNLFHPDAFSFSKTVMEKLFPLCRGFNHIMRTEDYIIHDRVLMIQKDVLNQLLHPKVLKRISDTSIYGNEYRINEFISDLTKAIYVDDMRGDVNTFRQNVQTEYVQRLIKVLKPSNTDTYGHHTQATIYLSLIHI